MNVMISVKWQANGWPDQGELAHACVEGLLEGLLSAKDVAISLCPADTGELRESIDCVVEAGDAGAVGRLAAGAAHAAFVELGTHKMAARPYLYPACAQSTSAILDAVANAVRGVLPS